MLATEDKSAPVGEYIDTKNLFFRVDHDIARGANQHLYITSDEELREGDHIMHQQEASLGSSELEYSLGGQVEKIEGNDIKIVGGGWYCNYKTICRKVIASTDPKITDRHQCPTCTSIAETGAFMICKGDLLGLHMCSNKEPINIGVPQPSQQFIELYCSLGGVGEFEVEFEEITNWGLDGEFVEYTNIPTGKYKLRIGPDNTINIRQVEATDYTKDVNFWKRLESFVKQVQVTCAMDEEEKEMILHNCKQKKK